MMKLEMGCKKHPRYKAILRPTRYCEHCLDLYLLMQAVTDDFKRDDGVKFKINGVKV